MTLVEPVLRLDELNGRWLILALKFGILIVDYPKSCNYRNSYSLPNLPCIFSFLAFIVLA